MRRISISLPLLVLFLLACRALAPTGSSSLPAETFVHASPSPSAAPTSISTVTPSPTLLATPAPPVAHLTPQPSPAPTHTLVSEQFTVRTHPDGQLYAGDLVSLEVIAPPTARLEERQVAVQIDTPEGVKLGPVDFGRHGIAGRAQATLLWAWDTSGLEPGEYSLNFSVLPDELIWTETVALLPQEAVPLPEPEARWATAESDCCIVYYITGTEAERDLPALLELADAQANKAIQRLGSDFEEPIPIVLLPRVLGHGGFASDEISISYLNRNYAGSSPEMVLHHEMVHILDSRLGGEFRPTMFVEGLAVYLTGGHFKPEPLMPRAAALLSPQAGCLEAQRLHDPGDSSQVASICGLDFYISLPVLADDFYLSQHEIGYLQAGALTEFIVETWGWDAFSAFYRDMRPPSNGSQAAVIDDALQEHFGLTLTEMDDRFRTALREEELTVDLVDDVYVTVSFYDTVRRYQQILDPSAYFLTAWLLDAREMRERAIVADYLRRPTSVENDALEKLLVAADQALRSGDYGRARELVGAVNAALDIFSQPNEGSSGSWPAEEVRVARVQFAHVWLAGRAPT